MFSRKDIKFLYAAIALLVITAILLVLESIKETQYAQTIVKNESDNTVIFKPENDSEPKEIAPNTSVEGVDGIKVSGKVFKACSGTHIVITNTNRIITKSLSGKVANTVRGGFISKAPDASWQQLFNV